MTKWSKSSLEEYMDFLNMMPPLCHYEYGYICGEPYDYRRCRVTGKTQAAYTAFIHTKKGFWRGRYITVPEFRRLDLMKFR